MALIPSIAIGSQVILSLDLPLEHKIHIFNFLDILTRVIIGTSNLLSKTELFFFLTTHVSANQWFLNITSIATLSHHFFLSGILQFI